MQRCMVAGMADACVIGVDLGGHEAARRRRRRATCASTTARYRLVAAATPALLETIVEAVEEAREAARGEVARRSASASRA